MYKIPESFRDTPEAKRLEAAQESASAIIANQIRLSFPAELRAASRAAQRELEEAQLAMDALTGEPGLVGLTQNVIDQIRTDFGADQQAMVMDLLDKECGRNLPFMRDEDAGALEPTRLAVLKLAKGDLGRLRQMIEAAKLDWKDVQLTAYHMDHPLED